MSVLTLIVKILSILFFLNQKHERVWFKITWRLPTMPTHLKKGQKGDNVIITTNLHIQLNYIVCIFSNILKQSNYYKIDFSWYFSKLDKIKKYIRLNSTLLLCNFLNLWFLFLNVCVIFPGVLEYSIQILC